MISTSTLLRTYIKPAFLGLPLLLGWILIANLLMNSISSLPQSPDARKQTALAHLRGLQYHVRDRSAAQRMQKIFPEGGCFTITLYGLAWTNLVLHFEIE